MREREVECSDRLSARARVKVVLLSIITRVGIMEITVGSSLF